MLNLNYLLKVRQLSFIYKIPFNSLIFCKSGKIWFEFSPLGVTNCVRTQIYLRYFANKFVCWHKYFDMYNSYWAELLKDLNALNILSKL